MNYRIINKTSIKFMEWIINILTSLNLSSEDIRSNSWHRFPCRSSQWPHNEARLTSDCQCLTLTKDSHWGSAVKQRPAARGSKDSISLNSWTHCNGYQKVYEIFIELSIAMCPCLNLKGRQIRRLVWSPVFFSESPWTSSLGRIPFSWDQVGTFPEN